MRTASSSLGLMLALVLTVCAVAAQPLIYPSPAKAILGIPGPCDLIPNDTAKKICQGVTDPVGTGINAATGALGVPSPGDIVGMATSEVANAILAPILNQLTLWEGRAVLAALTQTTDFMNKSTTPDMTQPWFIEEYVFVGVLVAMLAVMIYLARGVKAVKDKDVGEGGLASMHLAVFFVVANLLPWAVTGLVHFFDDGITPAYMATAKALTNDQIGHLKVQFSDQITLLNNPATDILKPLIYLFVGLISSVILEIILMLRMFMLYILTVGEIVALACLVAGRWGYDRFFRITNSLITLIPMKFVLAFALVLYLKLMASFSADAIVLGSVGLLTLPLFALWYYRWGSQHDPQLGRGWSAMVVKVRAAAALAAAA